MAFFSYFAWALATVTAKCRASYGAEAALCGFPPLTFSTLMVLAAFVVPGAIIVAVAVREWRRATSSPSPRP